jgi:hypothetical protein
MRSILAFAVLAVLSVSSFAAEIKNGATMQVKPNSIWFQDAAHLRRWQEMMKSGDSKALAAYQDRLLGARDAWQFIYPLTVKILRYEAAKNQVNVEIKTVGRMQGSTWFIEPDALLQ